MPASGSARELRPPLPTSSRPRGTPGREGEIHAQPREVDAITRRTWGQICGDGREGEVADRAAQFLSRWGGYR
eukprot:9053312-Alexandrium_andersonii.AAC.1